MENLDFQLQEVFREIVNRMETEGSFDREAYHSYIDEVLEEKISSGELDQDSNVKNYVEALQLMWPQAEALITKTDESGTSGISDEPRHDTLNTDDIATQELEEEE